MRIKSYQFQFVGKNPRWRRSPCILLLFSHSQMFTSLILRFAISSRSRKIATILFERPRHKVYPAKTGVNTIPAFRFGVPPFSRESPCPVRKNETDCLRDLNGARPAIGFYLLLSCLHIILIRRSTNRRSLSISYYTFTFCAFLFLRARTN